MTLFALYTSMMCYVNLPVCVCVCVFGKMSNIVKNYYMILGNLSRFLEIPVAIALNYFHAKNFNLGIY